MATVVKLIGVSKMLFGQCLPVLMEGQDGKRYVVKLAKNPELERVLVAEWIGHHIARELGIPVPDFTLVEISPVAASMIKDKVPWVTPGVHFGSLFLPTAVTGFKLEETYNAGKASSIIALDYLLYNADRADNVGNLLKARDAHGWGLYAIDFGHAFYAPIWDRSMLRQRVTEFDPSLLNGSVYKKLLPFVNGHSPFHSFLSALGELSGEKISQIVGSVPEEWALEAHEQYQLVEFIITRSRLLPNELSKLRTSMPWWKGSVH